MGVDEELKESDEKIRILYNKIADIEKVIDKERHLRELLIREKYNSPVTMRPKN